MPRNRALLNAARALAVKRGLGAEGAWKSWSIAPLAIPTIIEIGRGVTPGQLLDRDGVSFVDGRGVRHVVRPTSARERAALLRILDGELRRVSGILAAAKATRARRERELRVLHGQRTGQATRREAGAT